MGSATYIAGEKKDRPGLYKRITKSGSGEASGAIDGICAVTVNSSWGPTGEVTIHDTDKSVEDTYGTGGTAGIASSLFAAGAKKVMVYRLGTGGTKGTITLTDDSEVPADVVDLTTKYEGTRTLSVTIRQQLGYDGTKEFIVYEGATQMEKLIFNAGANEPDELVKVINSKSMFFTAAKKAAGNGTVKAVAQEAITAGTNPTVTNDSYSTAFNGFEPYTANSICVDTDDAEVHTLLHEFIKRTYETGKLLIGVVGEPTTVLFDSRLEHAAAFNDEKMVYVGGSAYDQNGEKVEGYKAAALVAGLVASTPSSSSCVHKVVPGLTDTVEKLTNTQYTAAIQNGMVLFSETGKGQVWMDSAVNTLVNPAENQDDGWKKIKRVKTRFELIDRIDRTVAPVIGKINCNADGVANIIKLGQDVIDAMVSEQKLIGGNIYEDPDNPFKNDSAWFIIEVDDLDTLEKIYFTYKFRFSVN